ncbi:MAG: AAA family ATPase [Phycisphaerales bacterium JB050]
MRTISIINQKGGSGKTTTAINLAACLAARGEPTLLVDMDPQGHCALGLAIPEDAIDQQIGDAMLAPEDRLLDERRLIWTVRRNLHLIPSTMRLASLEASRGGLADREDRDLRLAKVLRQFEDLYRWAIIDCPPSIGLLTYNAMRAASELLIPVETGYFALKGATKQVGTLESISRRIGAQTPYHILPTLHDPSASISKDIITEINRVFRKRVTPGTIRNDVRLREAASLGVPVVDYAPRSRSAEDYGQLAEWLTNKPAEHPTEPAAAPVPELKPFPTVAQPAQHLAGYSQVDIYDERSSARDHDSITTPGARSHETDANPAASSATMSRAAELAARARRLADATAARQTKREADPRVSVVMDAIDRDTVPNTEPSAALRRLFGAHQTSRGVLFVYPAEPDATVSIAGEFNGWSATANPMRFNSRVGVHEAILELKPGQHRYRLVIDGKWTADPFNPDSAPNPFGQTDSIIVVREAQRQSS